MSMHAAAIASVLAAVLLATGSGCTGKGPERAPKGAPAVVKGVVLETVTEKAIPGEMEAVGTVRARNSSVISARIPGTVSSLQIKEGERVAKGETPPHHRGGRESGRRRRRQGGSGRGPAGGG